MKLLRLHMPSQSEGKIASHIVFDVGVEQFCVKLKQLRRNFAIAAEMSRLVQTLEHSLNRIESVIELARNVELRQRRNIGLTGMRDTRTSRL